MITNSEILRQSNIGYDIEHPLTLDQKYQILEGLYLLAKEAGHFDPKDQHIDYDDVELAKALNANLSPPFGKDR